MNGAPASSPRLVQRLYSSRPRGRSTRSRHPPPTAAISPPFTVRITSPLGRTGAVARLRIVARVEAPEQAAALRTVKFFVDDVLLGEDLDGPPYSLEWTDENPFEPRALKVVASDTSGRTATDSICAEAIRSRRGVAGLERADRGLGPGPGWPLHRRPAVARVPSHRKRRPADARPRHAGDDAGDLHAADRQQPEHAAPDGLRAPGRGAADELLQAAGSGHRRAVLAKPRDGHRADQRSRHRHRRDRHDRVKGGTAIIDSLAQRCRAAGRHARDATRSSSSPTATTSTARGAIEDALQTVRSAGATAVRDRHRRRRRHFAQRRARASRCWPSRPAAERSSRRARTELADRPRAGRGGRAEAISPHLHADESEAGRHLAQGHRRRPKAATRSKARPGYFAPAPPPVRPAIEFTMQRRSIAD